MNKTVLIVDDNAFIRQALCELFAREANVFVCGQAANGKEAISQALETHPDLIVLDLSMPVMNGLDAARELKKLMPEVPLIMYSSFVEIFSDARLSGISVVVSKSEPGAVLISKARGLLFRAA
jgi:chemotaxis response regulator CheB